MSRKNLQPGELGAFYCYSCKDHHLRITEAWADFLADDRWNWQWYVTLTFKEEIHPEQAHKYFCRWIRQLNEFTYGKHFRKHSQGLTWVRGLEYQRRHVIHFHALISGLPDDVSRNFAMLLWENVAKNCGFARVYPYKDGACAYISKYVSKGGELDIWVGKSQKSLDLFSEAIFKR